MIFGLLFFCVVILCVNMSRSSFILYRIVKRHNRQSNVRRIWTCADNAIYGKNSSKFFLLRNGRSDFYETWYVVLGTPAQFIQMMTLE